MRPMPIIIHVANFNKKLLLKLPPKGGGFTPNWKQKLKDSIAHSDSEFLAWLEKHFPFQKK